MKKNNRVKLATNNHTDYIDKAYTMNQDLQEIIKIADEFIQFIERQEDNFSFLESYDDSFGRAKMGLYQGSAFENIGELGLDAIDDAVDSINEIQETMQTLSDQLEDNVKAVEKYLDNNF